MFDNLPDKEGAIASINQGKEKPPVFAPKTDEPEDIFAGINTGGITELSRPAPAMKPEFNRGSGWKKFLVIVVAILIIGGVGYAGYYIYTKYVGAPTNVNVANQNAANLNNGNANQNLNQAAIDSDNDGLTDVQELQAGTDPNNPDSDADGLLDGAEVNIYKTNPLNPDTDGDGFLDGVEVQNGYNPNGSGLLNVAAPNDYVTP